MAKIPLVTCLKFGTKYGPEYPNKLCAMTWRYLTVEHDFICLTDDPKGLACPYEVIEPVAQNWWSKIGLFKPYKPLEGRRVLYLDLDTVIVGNIDKLLLYWGQFAILKDWWARGYNSSVMSIAPGFGKDIWDMFQQAFWTEAYHGDQDFISDRVEKADIWQEMAPGLIGSYKADNLKDGPKDFKLIVYHGQPKPHELKGWTEKAWS